MLYQEDHSAMPNKTIYVSDADVPTFERAQELAGGNLSATIVQALRRFVEMEEAKGKRLSGNYYQSGQYCSNT